MMAVPIFAAWLAMASPHFELVTDASANLGRQVLADLERIRQALSPSGTPLPIRCFVFKRQDEFAHFRPTPITRAFFQSGPDRDFIVAAVENDGSIVQSAIFHEYVHLVLNHTTHGLPKWVDEGLAEYYSTIEFSGAKAVAGKPVARHVTTLKGKSNLSAADLADVTSESAEYREEARAALFYATAWAAMSGYASLNGGRPPLDSAAFGADLVGGYLEGFRKAKPQTFTWPMEATAELSDAVRSLTETEVAVMQIDLLLRGGDRDYAARLLDGIEQKSGASSLLERERALIALERGDRAEAIRSFERSISAPDADADSFFEYAVFLENADASADRIDSLLDETIARNPNHAEALFLRGRMLARAGRHGQAVPFLNRALAILPREEFFRSALEASREALRRSPGGRDDVRTPVSWSRAEGDATLIGQLKRVECLGTDARIAVEGEGRTVTLHIGDPRRVLVNESSAGETELRCGDQQTARSVEVRFFRTTSEVTSLRFR